MKMFNRLAVFLIAGGLIMSLAATDVAAQATAKGSASVLSTSISITQQSDLNFGQILPNGSQQTESVDPTSSSDAASFLVSGSKNAEVVLSYSANNLTDGSGNSVPYSMNMVGHKQQQAQAGAKTPSNPVKLNASGNYYLWTGGSITIAANQTPGTYETTITVNASYY